MPLYIARVFQHRFPMSAQSYTAATISAMVFNRANALKAAKEAKEAKTVARSLYGMMGSAASLSARLRPDFAHEDVPASSGSGVRNKNEPTVSVQQQSCVYQLSAHLADGHANRHDAGATHAAAGERGSEQRRRQWRAAAWAATAAMAAAATAIAAASMVAAAAAASTKTAR